ncbi:MAG: endonuclease [Acidobacteriota bacterium]
MNRFILASRLATLLGVALLATPVSSQVINEFVGNHTGPDNFEFVEILGAPSTDYSHLTILQIEGDVGDDAGIVQSVLPVGTTDAEGRWWTDYLDSTDFDNETYTILLVDGWSGSQGTDLDVGDDGTLDSTPWTSVIDSVGISQGGGGDVVYLAQTTLAAGFDGNSFPPGGASRIPDGTDTDAVGDWVRNDWDGAGLPGFTGTLTASEALNTPGAANSTSLPPAAPPVINEVVLDPPGTDDDEYIEIVGDGGVDYSDWWLVALDAGGQTADAWQVGSADDQGFWWTGFQTDSLPNESLSVLLVETWTGSVGQDLDTDDDGTLDVTPWTTVDDAVAFDGGAGQVYADVALSPTRGLAVTIPGASRIPNGLDTDQISDWQINDDAGAGLDGGFTPAPSAGEAWNTPGAVNRTNSVDYYASVDPTDATTLRTTLHAAIDDHITFPYTSSSTDTWDILELADQDPTNASNVLTIYENSSDVKFGGGTGAYNREHTWPRTYGFPDNSNSLPYTDTHHLRLSDGDYNSARGSRLFGTCNAGCTERATQTNAGFGGVGGGYPGDSNWFTGSDGSGGTWEVWNHRKGDVARSMLYMDIRYEGGIHATLGWAEPDLVLTDTTGLIQGTGSNTSGTAYMGRLSVLLAWHAADPPDADEQRRNDVIYFHQGNRNPFVDHPEWAACLFQNTGCGPVEPPLFADGFNDGTLDAWATSFP